MKMEFKIGDIVAQRCEILHCGYNPDIDENTYIVRFIFDEDINTNTKKQKLKDISKIPEEDREICKDIASKFIKYKKDMYPNLKVVQNACVDYGMLEIWKLHNTDGYSYDEIKNALRVSLLHHKFTAKNNFNWSDNFLTLTTARKKCSNQLTKFENCKRTYDKNPTMFK